MFQNSNQNSGGSLNPAHSHLNNMYFCMDLRYGCEFVTRYIKIPIIIPTEFLNIPHCPLPTQVDQIKQAKKGQVKGESGDLVSGRTPSKREQELEEALNRKEEELKQQQAEALEAKKKLEAVQSGVIPEGDVEHFAPTGRPRFSATSGKKAAGKGPETPLDTSVAETGKGSQEEQTPPSKSATSGPFPGSAQKKTTEKNKGFFSNFPSFFGGKKAGRGKSPRGGRSPRSPNGPLGSINEDEEWQEGVEGVEGDETWTGSPDSRSPYSSGTPSPPDSPYATIPKDKPTDPALLA